MKPLNYFMWGYQDSFRVKMEHRAEDVLKELGAKVEPKALLVGVRVPEVSDGHPVCIEPEDGRWSPELFSGCHDRAAVLYVDHPKHRMMFGDAPSMRDKPENIRRTCAYEAVREVTRRYDTTNSTRTFVGSPTRLDRYYVLPLLQVAKAELDAFPELPQPLMFDERPSSTGVVETLLRRLLSEASDALGRKDPGRGPTFDDDQTGLLRDAGRGVCNAIQHALKDWLLQDIFESLNTISSLPYEGTETHGEIIFAPAGSPSMEPRLTFLQPVRLESHRLARKMVEMSGRGLGCLCYGRDGLVGLGSARETAGGAAPVFRAVFLGHYRWDLYYGDLKLLTSLFGVPRVPAPRLTPAVFASTARRLLDLDGTQLARLWENVSAAMEQGHGTMLVISENAETEAKRLSRQALPIAPIALTPELVRRISGIDGAILVDRDSRCFAIGVILDGLASEFGDPSRGARFNSAIRYVDSTESATLCLVVSEDGQVDMIPTLLPQVSRAVIQQYVDRLATLTNDNFHETRNWLDKHRFYLTQDQCDAVNRELARIDAEPRPDNLIWITLTRFVPHPGMDDTYYLTEGTA